MSDETIGAYDFLIAGGRLSLDDWLGMSEDQRTMFRAAGEKMVAEFAAQVVWLLSSAVSESLGDLRLETLLDKAEKL